jgi:hypothetical protein
MQKARVCGPVGVKMEWLESLFTYIDPTKAGWIASLVIVALVKAAWDSLRGK